MPSRYGNATFYGSKAWKRVSAAYMSSMNYICERCGKPAQICHHKTWLDANNVHDATVSLNPDNLEALCIDCHNAEHISEHDIALFDTAGNMTKVKESSKTREYREQRGQIDKVLEKAHSLFCGFKKNDLEN